MAGDPSTHSGSPRAGSRGEGERTETEGARAKRFLEALGEEEIMLLRLRDELYEGRWDAMLADLNDRLQGKPYVFQLAHRIQDDIERIERLSRFERQHKVNLAEYL
ncbi:MAG: hypothetical protein WBD63_03635 [Phycisphaerae bacterium]|nr:hypothetical protein [Phycisphaerae bacterium]